METKKTNKKGLIIACILLALLAAAAAFLYIRTRAQGVGGSKTISVTVTAGDYSAVHTMQTDAEFLGEALTAIGLLAGEQGPYGLYVKTVDGITVDESKQQWWCFTKGGEELFTGVDAVAILDGDGFEAELKTGYESY